MTNRIFRSMLTGFLVLGMLGAGESHLQAQVEGSAPFSSAGTTPEAVAIFLKKLQKAVAAENAPAVAALVAYPLKAWDGKRTLTVKNRTQFIDLYNTIFSGDLLDVIADATVDSTFANYQGVMLASGRIWFSPDESDVMRIITINAPSGPKKVSREEGGGGGEARKNILGIGE